MLNKFFNSTKARIVLGLLVLGGATLILPTTEVKANEGELTFDGTISTNTAEANRYWIIDGKWDSDKDDPTVLTPVIRDIADINMPNAATVSGIRLSIDSITYSITTGPGKVSATAECVGSPLKINVLKGSS